MSTITRTMSVKEFQDAAPGLGRCELIKGEVRPMTPAGGDHGDLASRLHYFISRHVYENDLGRVYAAETGFITNAQNPSVRAPDVAYIHKSRTAKAKTPKFIPIPPDLCAEILSPYDLAGEVNDKVKGWLKFGAKLVWVADPETRTVTAYKPDQTARIYHESETLLGEEVLPGFQLPVKELFV